jgi:hypothetical protein
MGFELINTPWGPQFGWAVVTHPMLAQLVFAPPLVMHPLAGAQATVEAQADLHPLAFFPHRQPWPFTPQGQPPILAHETLLPRQLPLLAVAQADLLESTQPALLALVQAALVESPHADSLVAQADVQLVCLQANHLGPVLQPGNPANSNKAVGARAIHRLKAIMRNTPLNWSSRHSVQNRHAEAIRAKTGH